VSPISVAVLAVGLSVDSGIACIGRGAGNCQPRFSEAIRTGAIFGLVEATTPVIGWAAGLTARSYVVAFDHWIAFVLLALVGGHMVFDGLKPCEHRVAGTKSSAALFMMIATAVGTSVDAMAVGASLALIKVDVVAVALAVGATTFVFAAGGLMIGRFVGQRLGRRAEVVGGLALFGSGLSILIDHLWM
jgi:manganese efflux pump family protein